MGKPKTARMQQERPSRIFRIESIADNRAPDIGAMQSDLMGPSCLRKRLHPRIGWRDFKRSKRSPRGLSIIVMALESTATDRPNMRFHTPARSVPLSADDDPVFLSYAPLLEEGR